MNVFQPDGPPSEIVYAIREPSGENAKPYFHLLSCVSWTGSPCRQHLHINLVGVRNQVSLRRTRPFGRPAKGRRICGVRKVRDLLVGRLVPCSRSPRRAWTVRLGRRGGGTKRPDLARRFREVHAEERGYSGKRSRGIPASTGWRGNTSIEVVTGAAKINPRRFIVRMNCCESSPKALRISSKHCARELSVTAVSGQTDWISTVLVT